MVIVVLHQGSGNRSECLWNMSASQKWLKTLGWVVMGLKWKLCLTEILVTLSWVELGLGFDNFVDLRICVCSFVLSIYFVNFSIFQMEKISKAGLIISLNFGLFRYLHGTRCLKQRLNTDVLFTLRNGAMK